jgi:hypothetical protein
MFEFPFETQAAGGSAEKAGVAARLAALADAAGKLRRAGRRTWFTITGVGFDLPRGADADDAVVAARLARLGVAEPFDRFPSRTPAEVGGACGRLEDRVWYERKLAWVNGPRYDHAKEMRERPDIIRGMLREMRRAERRGLRAEFPVESDFDWGMVSGKLSALRWAFGSGWDVLDS